MSDRDLEQLAEPVLLAQVLTGDPLDHPPDRLPVDPRQPARRGLIRRCRQPRDQVLEVVGEPGTVTSERDALDQRAVRGTDKTPQPSVNLEPPDPEIEVTPDGVVMLQALTIGR